VELLMGKALEAASPQEVAHRTAEASGGGGREGENLSEIPGLGHCEGLQGHCPLAQCREAAGSQFTKNLLNATDDKVPRGGDGVGKLGAHQDPIHLGVLDSLEPGKRPLLTALPGAQPEDDSLAVSIENGARSLLEGPAHSIGDDNVLLIFTKHVHVVHVAKGGLPEPSHEEATQ
jgi:hypothetical protein